MAPVTPATIPGQGQKKPLDRGPGPDTRAGAMEDPRTDPKSPTTLLPGESEVATREDEYDGEVEKGIPPLPYLSFGPEVDAEQVERDVENDRAILSGEMQTRIEVLTGKRLQQKEGDPKKMREQEKQNNEEREQKAREKQEKQEREMREAREARDKRQRGEKPETKPAPEQRPAS